MRLNTSTTRDRQEAENTIPLINVVFLMLIFFLIAGTVARPLSKDLEPPNSEDMPLAPPDDNLVQMLKDGSFMYLGAPITIDALLEAIPAQPAGEEAITEDASGSEGEAPALRIIADKTMNSRHLIDALQRFRKAGHTDITLVTVRGN